MAKPPILVTGATGYIGGQLVPRLLEKEYPVRCLVRNPQKLKGPIWENVEIAPGDVLNPDTLFPALRGIHTAYYLVHSISAGEKGFEERDRKAAENFARAAKEAGLKRIIYLGGLGSEEAGLSPHLKSRHEVGDILRSSGIPVTEFRAAIIVGAGSISFKMVHYLTERLPIMICPRWLNTHCQPIAIDDVLSYLVAALEEPKSEGKIFEIGGADIMTYGDMMLGYAKVRGLKRFLIKVPVLTPRLSSYWVTLVTPIPPAFSRPLIEGLRNDVTCRSKLALEIFPIKPTGYLEAVRLALQ